MPIVRDRCTADGAYHFAPGLHTCPPLWEVCDGEFQTEDDYEWDPVYALNPIQAAEIFCERWDRKNGDYGYINAGHSEVVVRGKDGAVHRITVEAYMEPTYNANWSTIKVPDPFPRSTPCSDCGGQGRGEVEAYEGESNCLTCNGTGVAGQTDPIDCNCQASKNGMSEYCTNNGTGVAQ